MLSKNVKNMEKWKDVSNTFYQISDAGNVKNKNTNQYLGKVLHNDYYIVSLRINNKSSHHKIHRLVATYFIENPNNYRVVDHFDGNKLNNCVDNLRWITHSKNTKHWHDTKKTNNVLQFDLDNNLIKQYNTAKQASDETGIPYHHIYYCLKGIKDSCQNYIWKYNTPRKTHNKIIMDTDENYINIGKIGDYDFSNYVISKCGEKIINLTTKTEITKIISLSKYYVTRLCDKITKKMINLQLHRLYYCISNNIDYNDPRVVNHIDENKLNNNLINLELITIKKNVQLAIAKKVKQIDMKTNKVINTFDSISDAYKFLQKQYSNCIRQTCNGKFKQVYGYKWEWV